jgi:hypothetical protein
MNYICDKQIGINPTSLKQLPCYEVISGIDQGIERLPDILFTITCKANAEAPMICNTPCDFSPMKV